MKAELRDNEHHLMTSMSPPTTGVPDVSCQGMQPLVGMFPHDEQSGLK